MVSKKILKKVFENYKCGNLILVKEEKKKGEEKEEEKDVGYLFERREGHIYYLGKYIKNKRGFIEDFCSIEINVRNNKYAVYPGQMLPTELSYVFFELFRLSHFKDKEKSELEKKIMDIKIKS